jgi:LacI family transcriptional regulator
VAFIGDSPLQYITEQRLEGYKKALTEHNIEVDDSLIKYCPHDGTDAYEVEAVMQELFEAEHKPDAIFASTDRLTIATMRSCRDLKLNIPATVALAGFSNMDNTDLFCPSLTVIRQPAIQMGRVAARLLIKTIESKKPVTEFERQLLPTELRIGESSKARITVSPSDVLPLR